jgi:hypothetical protein
MDQRFASGTAATAAEAAAQGAESALPEQDAAGGISLTGRNRACARARALAGMVLASGIVISLGTMDTSVSSWQA